MSDVLERAKAHFAGLKGSTIDVPEWDCTIHFDPPTLAMRQQWMGMKESRAQAAVLIRCAKDAEGNPLFEDTPATSAAIQGAMDPHVVARVVKRILGDASPDEMGNG